MAKMNSTNLYVTTNQIILKSNPNNPSSWQDLYRLVPYLRNSLCCVVCGNLLIEPLTPTSGKCQHHVCNKCKSGRKKIKPACGWCKDCKSYTENIHLRILLQCYKKMCLMLLKSNIFRGLIEQASRNPSSGIECGASTLIMYIKEGAIFQDDYKSNGGLSKSTYSILPCVYTNSSTQTLQMTTVDNNSKNILTSNIRSTINRTPLYSVMYAGTGNKITIKRKAKDIGEIKIQSKKDPSEKAVFKKPVKSVLKQRRGCRCGNATATPGKLTCCGQRCPCYVEGKACIECKCRGCRNPHRPDGKKVRPHIPELHPLQYQITSQNTAMDQSLLPGVNIELDTSLTLEHINEHFKNNRLNNLDSFSKISTSLPHAILMNDDLTDDEDDEITVV